MALYQYGTSSRASLPTGKTEFEILKASHKFLRDEDDKDKERTWDEQLASKYYASLYREFAVCDLKHYKSGNFALRWRTEDEVLSGAGETTCANTRCGHYRLRSADDDPKLSLSTLELPFAYVEHGENKSALIKVVLCGKCVDKLMWKRRKEKTFERSADTASQPLGDELCLSSSGNEIQRSKDTEEMKMREIGSRWKESHHRRGPANEEDQGRHRKRTSRSPQAHRDNDTSHKRRRSSVSKPA